MGSFSPKAIPTASYLPTTGGQCAKTRNYKSSYVLRPRFEQDRAKVRELIKRINELLEARRNRSDSEQTRADET
jgi:hypothetical protein